MNVDPNGSKWWEFGKWDWTSIGKIALGVVTVARLAVASVFTGGGLSVIFAGAAMGGKLLLQDVAMNISKNFLQHTVAYLGKEFFVRFGIEMFLPDL